MKVSTFFKIFGCIFVGILLLPCMASALLANGNFEMEDLSHWDDNSDFFGTGLGIITVEENAAYTGSFGANLSSFCNTTDDMGRARLERTIDATNLTRISFWYYVDDVELHGSDEVGTLYAWLENPSDDGITWTLYLDEEPVIGEWTQVTLTRSEISEGGSEALMDGDVTLRFFNMMYHPGGEDDYWINWYIDDVELEYEGGERLINGDFETGDTRNWDEGTAVSGDGEATIVVDGDAAHTDVYGASLYTFGTTTDDIGRSQLKQQFDPVGLEDITFWYKVAGAEVYDTQYTVMLIAWVESLDEETSATLLFIDLPVVGDWTQVTVTRAEIEASYETALPDEPMNLVFYNSLMAPGSNDYWANWYIDDVEINYGEGGGGSVNGTFIFDGETGDLDDWTADYGGYGTHTEYATVTTDSAYNGTYGLRLNGTGTGYPSIMKDIPGNFTSLDFWYKVNATSGSGDFWIDMIIDSGGSNSAKVFEVLNPSAGDWTHVVVDKSDILTDGAEWDEGELEIWVNAYTGGSGQSFDLYFDDLFYEPDFSNPPNMSTNLDLEFGNLTNWYLTNYYKDYVFISEDAARSGNYGLTMCGTITNPDQLYPHVNRKIPHDFENISFWYKVNNVSGSGTPNDNLYIYMETDDEAWWLEILDADPTEAGDWTQVFIDRDTVAFDNGMIESDWGTDWIDLEIEPTIAASTAGTNTFEIYFDDFLIDGQGGSPPAETGFNGDFETGDLPDWVDASVYDAGATATSTVTTGAAHAGSYGYRMYGTTDWGNESHPGINQSGINVSSMTGLSLFYKINQSEVYGEFDYQQIQIYVTDINGLWMGLGSLILEQTTTSDWQVASWSQEDLDNAALGWESEYGENTTLIIMADFIGGSAATEHYEVFIDDIELEPYSGTITGAFTINPNPSGVGQEVQFNDTSTGNVTAWFWDFSDGNVSYDQNPTHTFYAGGSYWITLNASNDMTFDLVYDQLDVSYFYGYGQQDIETDAIYQLALTFKDSVSEDIIDVVDIIDNLNNTYTTTDGTFTHNYNYSEISYYFTASGYAGTGHTYVMDQNRTATVYMVENGVNTTPTASSGYSHQVSYVPHLVRLRAIDYMGKPINDMDVSAVGIETTGEWSWITDILGIDTNETPIHNTSMSGHTGSDGAIVFLMVETIQYNIEFEKPGDGISESHHLYPKEDSYEYVFWTETPVKASGQIYISMWNQTNLSDSAYVDLFATYIDTGTTTDNLTFTVEAEGNVTVFSKSSATPNIWNTSYPVLKEKGKAYLWTISGNSTRFPERVGKAKIVAFEGSPLIPADFGEWNPWIALTIIFVVATLFGRASIKYATAIVPLLTLFFWYIGYMPSLNYILVSVIVFLGLVFYMRYAEQESDL